MSQGDLQNNIYIIKVLQTLSNMDKEEYRTTNYLQLAVKAGCRAPFH